MAIIELHKPVALRLCVLGFAGGLPMCWGSKVADMVAEDEVRAQMVESERRTKSDLKACQYSIPFSRECIDVNGSSTVIP